MARRPLVMGNWKLNGSKAFTKELIEGLKAELHDVTGCDVAIAPPVMYLGTAEAALAGSQIALGAQNVDVNVKGAFTGDISTEMLKDFGAKYIIIGHSERRTYHKESDEFVAKKFSKCDFAQRNLPKVWYSKHTFYLFNMEKQKWHVVL